MKKKWRKKKEKEINRLPPQGMITGQMIHSEIVALKMNNAYAHS